MLSGRYPLVLPCCCMLLLLLCSRCSWSGGSVGSKFTGRGGADKMVVGRRSRIGPQAHGYRHRITYLSEHPEPANQLLPRVHLVTSLLKRWLLGTHQGAVSPAHLDSDLDEFTCRFNRRRSRHRGMLFYRLAQQAGQVAPVPYTAMVKDAGRGPRRDHKM